MPHRHAMGWTAAKRRRITREHVAEWATIAAVVALLLFTGFQPR